MNFKKYQLLNNDLRYVWKKDKDGPCMRSFSKKAEEVYDFQLNLQNPPSYELRLLLKTESYPCQNTIKFTVPPCL